MSNGEVRKISVEDIQLVQNLIERCLQLYMSQREVVITLLDQAKIEPCFTELVWQKLEAENQEFFREYYLRLIVKNQILQFNELLERQVELMCQISQTRVAPIPLTDGSRIHSMHNILAYEALQPAGSSIKLEKAHQEITTMHNVYTNGASSMLPSMQYAVNMAGHAQRIDAPSNMLLAQSSNAGMMQGLNRVAIKTEGGYAGDSRIMFSANNNLVEPRNAIQQVLYPHFSCGGLGQQALHESLLEQEMNSYGHFGQISRSYSLSDLTADFSNSTG